MNIVYAMTRNVYKWILPSLRSLAEHHPDASVFVLAEDNKLPFELPIKCKIINISKNDKFLKSVNINNRFGGYINLLKVYYPTILHDLDKVIHLDIDTIICDSLDDFWNTDVDGKWFASVPEYIAHHGREQNKVAVVPLRFNENQSTGYTDNPAIVHYCGIKDWHENRNIYRREYMDKYLDTAQKYMIHVCNDREWYVKDFLLPSLLEQGIEEDNIIVWHDYDCIGNLASWVASCKWIAENLEPYNSTWHLQDDVVIGSNFRDIAEKKYTGFANAFCNNQFDGERTNYIGEVSCSGMWFSFQCILIPNRLMDGFVKWMESGEAKEQFPDYVNSGKCDDSLFREYVTKKMPNLTAINIFPCIVDHIDYLMGGTVINKQRKGKRQAYWRSDDLDDVVAELEEKLAKRNK